MFAWEKPMVPNLRKRPQAETMNESSPLGVPHTILGRTQGALSQGPLRGAGKSYLPSLGAISSIYWLLLGLQKFYQEFQRELGWYFVPSM